MLAKPLDRNSDPAGDEGVTVEYQRVKVTKTVAQFSSSCGGILCRTNQPLSGSSGWQATRHAVRHGFNTGQSFRNLESGKQIGAEFVEV